MSYSPLRREFTLEPSLTDFSEDVSVAVEIEDSRGLTTQYILWMSYRCNSKKQDDDANLDLRGQVENSSTVDIQTQIPPQFDMS